MTRAKWGATFFGAGLLMAGYVVWGPRIAAGFIREPIFVVSESNSPSGRFSMLVGFRKGMGCGALADGDTPESGIYLADNTSGEMKRLDVDSAKLKAGTTPRWLADDDVHFICSGCSHLMLSVWGVKVTGDD